MEQRYLGKTGELISVIGLGAIVFVGENSNFATETVARAIDAGINYFDMGPAYGRGEAEEKGGPAIKPYRDNIFLAEKTKFRKAKDAENDLRNSLKKMGTDYFDLYQFHAVTTNEDVESIIGPGGALEAVVKAQEQGLVRFIGFSAHSEEAALKLLESFNFDTVLFPINYVAWHQGNFGKTLLSKADETDTGILALKSLAQTVRQNNEQKWHKAWYRPIDNYDQAKQALKWTLSKPVTSCVSPSHSDLLWWMVQAEKETSNLQYEDFEDLKTSAAGFEPIFSSNKH